MEPDDILWHPMSKKVKNGTSGATSYHRVTQFYHRVPQFFIGLCNFNTRLQIPRVPIWNTGLHSYRRGPAWSVICSEKFSLIMFLAFEKIPSVFLVGSYSHKCMNEWFVLLFSYIFSIFRIQKGVQVIRGIELNIRIMSSVTMLKHIIFL